MGLVPASPAQQPLSMETAIDNAENCQQIIICTAVSIIDKLDAEL
jgi:hypothetical protein